MGIKRPASLIVAIVLSFIINLFNLIMPLTPGMKDAIPAPLMYADVVVGIIGMVAVFGLWRLSRWGMILTIVIMALNILSAAPGLVLADSPVFMVVAGVFMAVCAGVIVLSVLPSARKAYAAQHVAS